MALKFYNTLTRKKEDFIPIDKKMVTFYSCGPTVYNYPHIGNYRAYIFADTLKRVLLYEGYNVKHIMNLTDVDDKTIRDSKKAGKSLKEFTEFYTQEFFKEIKSLNILEPAKFTKATDYIPKMISIIEKLLEKKLAYKSEDGSIYFDIKKFSAQGGSASGGKGYGQLSHLDMNSQKENASGRIKSDEYDKDNVQDFALWKAWDEKDGDVYWDADFGKGLPRTELALVRGRPGWHIECSAMSMENLGEQIDIHTGGVDNIFPHHENEIAQSEGATEKHFVNYWMHNEWVLVDQKKMAKSEKNFYTLKDLVDKGINPIAYRFWLLMANYRTRINFNWEALLGAETALKRLYGLYNELGVDMEGKIDEKSQQKFKAYLEDDLDTPRALTVLWDVLKGLPADKEGETLSNADKKATVLDFDRVLGLGFENIKTEKIPEEIQKLVTQREQARQNKDFKNSDELRKEINALGYEVKDTAEGQKVTKM